METVEDVLISANEISQCANPGCTLLTTFSDKDEDGFCEKCHLETAMAFVKGLHGLLEEDEDEAF